MRRWLCEQNECLDAARTERQKSAAALGCMQLAAQKEQTTPFFEDDHWG